MHAQFFEVLGGIQVSTIKEKEIASGETVTEDLVNGLWVINTGYTDQTSLVLKAWNHIWILGSDLFTSTDSPDKIYITASGTIISIKNNFSSSKIVKYKQLSSFS